MPRIRVLAACALWAVAAPVVASAQQGSVQVTAAAQTIKGDPRRIAGQAPFEPDFGVSWLQPGTRFGLFQIELRGTRRGDLPHLGKVSVSARDLRYRGAVWSVEAGDTYFSPAIGDYRFANLSTPALTFAGGAISARTPRAAAGLLVGRATAWRNFFGTDADTLDQQLALARASYRASDRLELFTRGSHVRTGDLKDFTSTIAVSDQGGIAARWIVTPAVHLIGDGSLVSYREHGAQDRELDASALAGASLLISRGWVQINAARFSPGELPVISQPLTDRGTFFAAGELDAFARLRVFGGWEAFRSNLDPQPSSPPSPTGATQANDGTRGFGGVRMPVGAHSSVALRLEQGDRRSRPAGAGQTVVSDTGIVTAEWQAGVGALASVARYSRRQNVEADNLAGSHTVDDTSAHLFVNVTRSTQIFGNAVATKTTARDGAGNTFWQIGGGSQAQLLQRSLWLRGEGTFSRNVDILSALVVPQQSINFGLNGEIARNYILGININADRLASPQGGDVSWISRSSVRLTRNFQTSAARSVTSFGGSMARHSGTGTIAGVVFSDWNANGRQDPGEILLENIPIRLTNLGSSTTSPAGDFAFINVPVGLQQVEIDPTALPVDFDPPSVPRVQLQLGRGETKRVAFGVVPLSTVSGGVVLDANRNGVADPGEARLDGAVLVLDGGARSEQVRKGQFRFDAVRSGDHTLTLLQDSLPEGSRIAGSAEIAISLTHAQPRADVSFVVSIEPRQEQRRIFAPSTTPSSRPPADSTSAPRHPLDPPRKPVPPIKGRAATPRATRTGPPPASAMPGAPRVESAGEFAIQVIALNDPARAREIASALRAEGLPAYVLEPPPSDPDGPYRVRVGRFATSGEAEAVATALGKARGERPWVIRER